MDPRGNKGIFSKGRNVYDGVSSRPNPEGTNQHGTPTPVDLIRPQFQTDGMGNVKKLTGQDLQKAAKLRLKKKGM